MVDKIDPDSANKDISGLPPLDVESKSSSMASKQDIADDKDSIEAAAANSLVIPLFILPQLPAPQDDFASFTIDSLKLTAVEYHREALDTGSTVLQKWSESIELDKEMHSARVEKDIKTGALWIPIEVDKQLEVAANFNKMNGLGRMDLHSVGPAIVMLSLTSNVTVEAVEDKQLEANTFKEHVLMGSVREAQTLLPQKVREDIGALIIMEMIALQYASTRHAIAQISDEGKVEPKDKPLITGAELAMSRAYADQILGSIASGQVDKYLSGVFSQLVRTDTQFASTSAAELTETYSPLFRLSMLLPAFGALIAGQNRNVEGFQFGTEFSRQLMNVILGTPESEGFIYKALGEELQKAYGSLNPTTMAGFSEMVNVVQNSGGAREALSPAIALTDIIFKEQLAGEIPHPRGTV